MANSPSDSSSSFVLRSMGAVIAWTSHSALRRALVIVLIASAVLLPGLAGHGPTDEDEALFAQASKQMLESGDFVDIRFQDDPRHKKPIGIYWAQAASASFFGGADAEIWAYRLPSALAAILAALLTVWAARPLIGPRAAFLAGAMTAALLVLSFEARTAKTDAFLLAATVAAMGALARLWFGDKDDPKERGWNIFYFWTALAIGVLIKGPIIFMPVLGAIIWMALRERSVAGLGRLGTAWGLPWLLLLAAPWFVAIAAKTDGSFFTASVGGDLFGKVGEGKEKHWGPPGYHGAAFWGAFWPWTALALVAIPHVWNWRRAPETAFLLGWIVPAWVVFELVATKLPHYTLPTYPALCALVAAAALDGGVKAKGALFWIGAALWAAPALALPLFFGLGPTIIEGRLILAPMLGAAVTLLVLFAAWRWLMKGVWLGFIRASILGAGLLYFTAYQLSFPAMSPAWISGRLTEIAQPHRDCRLERGGSGSLASIGYSDPSLVFLAGTGVKLFSGGEGPNRGADFLAADPSALIWVEGRRLEPFLTAVAAREIDVAPIAETDGFQYSRGKFREFTLFGRADQAASNGCAATSDGDDA